VRRAHHAARHVHDPAWSGTGNWSFNTAWAATLTGHAFVTRLHDLREADPVDLLGRDGQWRHQDHHVAELGLAAPAGAHAAHGDAARLERIHQRQERVGRRGCAHVGGNGNSDAQRATGGDFERPERQRQSAWAGRSLPGRSLDRTRVDLQHRIVLESERGQDDRVYATS
jgi:hypothetical protein